jgi:hypothetical protein
MYKVECPNCVAIKPGILFSVDENATGCIQGKCKKCGAFVTYCADTKQVLEVELPKNKG